MKTINIDADLANADWSKSLDDIRITLPAGQTIEQWMDAHPDLPVVRRARRAQRLGFGDVVGHDFHGNQHTGGIGGGGSSSAALGMIPGTDPPLPRISAAHARALLVEGAKALPAGPYTTTNPLTGVSTPTPQAALRMEAVGSLLSPQIVDALTTDRASKGVDGLYADARLAQQQQIIDGWRAAADAAGVPHDSHAIVMGGMPGSGKGSIQSSHAADLGLVRDANGTITSHAGVDPDYFKQALIANGMAPSIPGLTPLELAPIIHEESSDIAARAQQGAMDDHLNLIVDKTLNSDGQAIKTIQPLLNHGYDYRLVGANTTVAQSASNVLGRYSGGMARTEAGQSTLGGRVVAAPYLASMIGPPGYASKSAVVMERVARGQIAGITDPVTGNVGTPTQVDMYKAGAGHPVRFYTGSGANLSLTDAAIAGGGSSAAHIDAATQAATALAERLHLDYSGDQPRDENGRWSGGGGSGPTRATDLMATRLQSGGGFTISAAGREPHTGYAVAVEGFSSVRPASDYATRTGAAAAIKEWLHSPPVRAAFAANPRLHVGGWWDKANGVVVLDPSEVVASKAEAVALGTARNQVAIWDLANHTDVPTGGSGGYVSAAEALVRRLGRSGHPPNLLR